MPNSIQHIFWGNGKVNGIQDYPDALATGAIPGDGQTPIGQLDYYQYRLNRKYDVFRWRGAQGFSDGTKIDPSLHSYTDARYLLSQTVPGHTPAIGCEGTIITLEYTWRFGSPSNGISAASIINGNFDFGPYSRMSTDPLTSDRGGAPGRWAQRPQSFTAPIFGVGYGARSYVGGNMPTTWVTSFNPDSSRSGSPGSYSITAGNNGNSVGAANCYSLFELGLDILYLTNLFPNAVFIMDHVLEVNISHGSNPYLNDIPQDVNADTALTRANYSDALLHIIAFREAMGIFNVIDHIGLAGPAFYNGGGAGSNSADPWWGNILAQEKNDSSYGVINSNYATGRTWVPLAGRDMYSGQNGATAYRSPDDMVGDIVSWCHRFDKYGMIWTTGITDLMDDGTPGSGAQHATYPKNGTLKASGLPVIDGDNFFSAFKIRGDTEMGLASPRLWGVCYQIGFETQTPGIYNDYSPESDSIATNRGTRTSPLGAPPITTGNIYGNSVTDPTGGRNGWIAFWDWLNASNWKGGSPLLLPSGPTIPPPPTTDRGNWGMTL